MQVRSFLTLVALLAVSFSARAQNDGTLDINLSNPQAPVATWTTTPAGATCTASGDWSGTKPANGNETLPRPDGNPTYTLNCAWTGNQMTTITWVNPTTNTDGTPLTNPGPTIVAYTQGPNFDAFDCMNPASSSGYTFASRAHPLTTFVIDTLPVGTWRFGAFKVNTLGLCSAISNIATKNVSAGVTVSNTVSFTVPNSPMVSVE